MKIHHIGLIAGAAVAVAAIWLAKRLATPQASTGTVDTTKAVSTSNGVLNLETLLGIGGTTPVIFPYDIANTTTTAPTTP